jgi:hypothetical protein
VQSVAAQAPEKYLELLRSDIRADRVAIVTEALDLPADQAAAFWPIYRQYEKEVAVIGDRRVALVKRFAASYGTMTDDDANGIAREWFAIHDERMKLLKQYHKQVGKAVSAVVAAQFVQVEHALNMLVDLQIAAELPLIE